MSNPLYGLFGSGMQGPMNATTQLMQRFQQFQQTFRGDPKQQVQQLLNSGRVSQGQYDQAVRIAQQMQRILGGK